MQGSEAKVSSSYTESLVTTRSRDGFLLEGLVIAPTETADKPAKLVWIHGIYAAFYAPPGLGVCRELAAAGVTCVVGNTRGHNVGSWLRNADGRVVLAGGAWEVFADCVHDIAGWIEFAAADWLFLAGHSLGARKVTLYQAHEQDRRVRGLVLASPDTRVREIDEPTKKVADELIRSGQGANLLPLEQGWAASADNYMSRFAAGSIAEAFATRSGSPLLAAVETPVLAVLGVRERKSREDAERELSALRSNAARAQSFATAVVDGDHLYTGVEQQVAAEIARWIASRR
jgi:pimeloyl-ACP methyl ester carboxylesterase